ANQVASSSAGIQAPSGPPHGGANEAGLTMLGQIRESGQSVQRFVESVKNKEQGVKLMGFGHRVFKNYDPRAKLVKDAADEVLSSLGVSDPLLDLAKELEEIALADDYFKERRLYPNGDFYTGVIYKAMGFPTRMFTVLFAIGRLPGWLAQWRELNLDPQTKIGRPQQLYIGSPEREFPRRYRRNPCRASENALMEDVFCDDVPDFSALFVLFGLLFAGVVIYGVVVAVRKWNVAKEAGYDPLTM